MKVNFLLYFMFLFFSYFYDSGILIIEAIFYKNNYMLAVSFIFIRDQF